MPSLRIFTACMIRKRITKTPKIEDGSEALFSSTDARRSRDAGRHARVYVYVLQGPDARHRVALSSVTQTLMLKLY